MNEEKTAKYILLSCDECGYSSYVSTANISDAELGLWTESQKIAHNVYHNGIIERTEKAKNTILFGIDDGLEPVSLVKEAGREKGWRI